MQPESGNGICSALTQETWLWQERDINTYKIHSSEITVTNDSIAAIRCQTEQLPTELPNYKERMSDHKLKGVDMESHAFMTQVYSNSNERNRELRNPGIESGLYYQAASATYAAYLRRLLTKKIVYDG